LQLRTATRSSGGFTLIELMTVVVVATILLSLAVPSYMSQVRRSRRTEAKTAVLDLAGREERYLSTNGALYSTTPTDMGYLGAAFPVPVAPDNYYTLTVCAPATAAGCDPNANPPPAPSYYITATPVAGTTQANDAECTSFSVDSTGQQFSTGTLPSQQCWGH
jgi:type IV pilus assembly protein PilE